MEDANRDVLRERLAALEETVAFQNRVGLVGLLAFVAMLSIGWLASRPSRDLVVDSLELRDKTGTVRSRLALNADGSPLLSMFDHKGIKLVTMGQTFQSSSALSFYDEGEARMQLTSISKGVSSLRFMNDANETQSSIYIRPDRGMGISLASASEGLFLGLEPNGKPGFRLVDVDEAKEGRAKLAPEELERFALPVKGQGGTFADPRSQEAKNAEGVRKLTPADSGAAAASITPISSITSLAMNREPTRCQPVD